MDGARLQSILNGALAKGAAIAGLPFDIYRPTGPSNPLAGGNKILTLPASFSVDYRYKNRAAKYDDVLWTALVDGSRLQPGDFLVGASGAFFVAIMDPLLPIACVRCNRTVSVERENPQTSAGGGQAGGLPSQTGSAGTYWGSNAAVVTNETDVGRKLVASGVPCGIVGTAGRATGTGELPSDAPGPSRWRVHLPVSCCPKGSVQDRDIIVDEEGGWYQVSAAVWTPLGYRAEAVRLQN